MLTCMQPWVMWKEQNYLHLAAGLDPWWHHLWVRRSRCPWSLHRPPPRSSHAAGKAVSLPSQGYETHSQASTSQHCCLESGDWSSRLEYHCLPHTLGCGTVIASLFHLLCGVALSDNMPETLSLSTLACNSLLKTTRSTHLTHLTASEAGSSDRSRRSSLLWALATTLRLLPARSLIRILGLSCPEGNIIYPTCWAGEHGGVFGLDP